MCDKCGRYINAFEYLDECPYCGCKNSEINEEKS